MASLVDDLLLLTRLDEGRPLAREAVDLGVLGVDAAADAPAVAPDRVVIGRREPRASPSTATRTGSGRCWAISSGTRSSTRPPTRPFRCGSTTAAGAPSSRCTTTDRA